MNVHEQPSSNHVSVLADRRAEVERAVAAHHRHIRMSVRRTSRTGYRDGIAAACSADLGRTGVPTPAACSAGLG
ncbi:hypothetical protein AB0392_29775 [Nonomuraea angiospora]|uniref:hypothetical protein n=1 Tax=Nonomuraea angiospora TaxID=46172 RepID=UPI00344BA8D3